MKKSENHDTNGALAMQSKSRSETFLPDSNLLPKSGLWIRIRSVFGIRIRI